MLKVAIIGYLIAAGIAAVMLAANRKSWFSKHANGGGEIDLVLALIWGLFWPITLVVWMTRESDSKTDTKSDN